jgi:hypothetical protein
MNLLNIAGQMRDSMQRITGVNEFMQGTSGGNRDLVGTTQMAIQRGTLMQEPFYFSLSKVLLQAYQSIVSQGKRIYADSRRKISMITGDEGAECIIITQDMKAEDFRVFIKRTGSSDQAKTAANQTLMQMVSAGMIDQITFANYFNRSDMDDVGKALREYQAKVIEAQRLQQKQQAQMAEQVMPEMQRQMTEQQTEADTQKLEDDMAVEEQHQREIEKIEAKKNV